MIFSAMRIGIVVCAGVIIACLTTSCVKPKLHIAGVYKYRDNPETGPVDRITIYPKSGDSALFHLLVCRGAPSYNLCEMVGEMAIKDNVGTYLSDSFVYGPACVLQFIFSKDTVAVVEDTIHHGCYTGAGVYIHYDYAQVDANVPEHFIDLHSDTILFKDLTAYKYYHRFDIK